ncbi:unnamed protein product [Candidula unifasciata]|uniref:Sperm microtubule inner protein 1 C-terminal domain-containing protein n=1 Tax=Candidula unifasciata TaxID=100452 RepID=A0A8S3YLF3_9EUPU|nr:unnamed protein product [Candidula unifasciata]
MARNPYANTQMQSFWKETVEKEAAARLLAFRKQKGQPRNTARQLEVFRKKILDSKPSDAVLELPPISSHKKKTDLDDSNCADKWAPETLLNAPEMRPVTPEVRKTLYNGFTKEGKGRHVYLHHRYEKDPEEKYTFPTCTSWEYGWKLGEVIKKDDIKKPKYGRYRIVENTFYTRNGLMSSYSRGH